MFLLEGEKKSIDEAKCVDEANESTSQRNNNFYLLL
jgi:hypothetical protein